MSISVSCSKLPDKTNTQAQIHWYKSELAGTLAAFSCAAFRKNKLLLDSILDAIADQLSGGKFGFVLFDRGKVRFSGRMRGDKQLAAILVRDGRNLECADTSSLIDDFLFVHAN